MYIKVHVKYKGAHKSMKVAAINDLSGFGKCSLYSDITVLSAMGIQCCPVPTAVLSAQTGYPSYYCKDLTGIIPRYSSEWEKQGEIFDGIITGFMVSPEQAKNSLDFIRKFKGEKTIVLVDPVMADDGEPYDNYSESLLTIIREMVKEADIITPNLTELVLLAGEDPHVLQSIKGEDILDYVEELSSKVRKSEDQILAVTGINLEENTVCNYIDSGSVKKVIKSSSDKIHYSGTGDVFAAVMLGAILKGSSAADAALLAGEFIQKCIADTVKKGSKPIEGIALEGNLHMLGAERKN